MSLARYEEAAMAFRKGVEYEPQNDDLKQKLEDAERQAKYAPKRFKEDGVRFPSSLRVLSLCLGIHSNSTRATRRHSPMC
jgi:hypothetical protein